MSSARRTQPQEQADPLRDHLPAVGVIAVGGGIGSVARYGLSRAVHPAANGFPVATFVTNVVGALLLGALIVAVIEVWRPHHLVRPLLGTGLLGGFTTFSTFAVETRGLSSGVATGYVLATLGGSLFAAWAGMNAVRLVEPRLHPALEHELVDPFDPDLP
jgi:CrcB protein